MKELKTLRPFNFKGKDYRKNQAFLIDERNAEYLVSRNLAIFLAAEIVPNQDISPIVEGENKMLKKETVNKPGRRKK